MGLLGIRSSATKGKMTRGESRDMLLSSMSGKGDGLVKDQAREHRPRRTPSLTDRSSKGRSKERRATSPVRRHSSSRRQVEPKRHSTGSRHSSSSHRRHHEDRSSRSHSSSHRHSSSSRYHQRRRSKSQASKRTSLRVSAADFMCKTTEGAYIAEYY